MGKYDSSGLNQYLPQSQQYQPQSQQQEYAPEQGGTGGYFCASSNSYYPQAMQCAEGWQQVDARR